MGFVSSHRGFSLQPWQCNLVLSVGRKAWWLRPLVSLWGLSPRVGSDDDSFGVMDYTDATTKTQLSSSCVKFLLTPLGCSLDVCFRGGGSLPLLFKLHDTNLDSI